MPKKRKGWIQSVEGDWYKLGKKEYLLEPKPVEPVEIKPTEKPTRVDVILELKVMRRLLEVVGLIGCVGGAFDEFHVGEFLKGDGYGDDEEEDAPFNLAFVMASMNTLSEWWGGDLKKELKAYALLSGALEFVAGKNDEISDILRELVASPLSGIENCAVSIFHYRTYTLPRLLKIIDLAIKKDEARGE